MTHKLKRSYSIECVPPLCLALVKTNEPERFLEQLHANVDMLRGLGSTFLVTNIHFQLKLLSDQELAQAGLMRIDKPDFH